MKQDRDLSGFLHPVLYGFCIMLTSVQSAFANNAPGPLAVVSILTAVVLIVILTFAGGGYKIMKRLDDVKYTSKVTRTVMNTLQFIAGIILFFVGVMASIIGVVGFSIYAIARGIRMIKWSKEAMLGDNRPTYVEGVNPKRLKIAGIVLIVLTLMLMVFSFMNIAEVVGFNPSYKKKAYAATVNSDARNAFAAAQVYLEKHPKAKVATCADLEEAGYKPSHAGITCFSDMNASSGSIRITAPEDWKLSNPTATITFSGELTRAIAAP